MEVITDRPIYNYASGGDDFSYLTEEEKALKAKQKKEKAQKIRDKANAFLQSDYTKATVGALTGVGAQKIQNWASTGSGTGSGTQNLNLPVDYQPLPPITDSTDSKGAGSKTGIWTKVAIGVGIVTVLGVATYFILKSKKGKPSKK